ncbi:MAG: ATP-dependent RecD-like DNA helicase [Lachnospiraceae bacterium]
MWKSLMAAREKTGNQELSIDVRKIEQKLQMEYDGVQAEAIRQAATCKVMVLTGGPGTGKTTTVRGIISAYETFGLNILLAAPTGRAAKRMTEATGLEAKTLHRLLEAKPPEGYQKNEENPLEGDVLIVDECSMIDIVLMNALLRAIPPHMRLVLVGDVDQLPSVGAGNVLRDLMDSGVCKVVRLTKIFRQAQSSRIIMNAHRINEGLMPDLSNGKTTDFFFTEKEDPEEAVAGDRESGADEAIQILPDTILSDPGAHTDAERRGRCDQSESGITGGFESDRAMAYGAVVIYSGSMTRSCRSVIIMIKRYLTEISESLPLWIFRGGHFRWILTDI